MLEQNMTAKIHSYKHDKTIHRVWNNIVVLDKSEHEVVMGVIGIPKNQQFVSFMIMNGLMLSQC